MASLRYRWNLTMFIRVNQTLNYDTNYKLKLNYYEIYFFLVMSHKCDLLYRALIVHFFKKRTNEPKYFHNSDNLF